MRIKLGLVGTGRQGQRYLDPNNWPDGVEVERFTRCPNCAGVIVATPANVHEEFTLFALEKLHLPVLVEKPTHASPVVARRMFAVSRRTWSPLMTAFVHLYSSGFRSVLSAVSPDREYRIHWQGPGCGDGTCSAAVDWGCHGYAMAYAISRRLPVPAPILPKVFCCEEERRRTEVLFGKAVLYDGAPESPPPMRRMLRQFVSKSVINRERDTTLDEWVNDQLEKLCES